MASIPSDGSDHPLEPAAPSRFERQSVSDAEALRGAAENFSALIRELREKAAEQKRDAAEAPPQPAAWSLGLVPEVLAAIGEYWAQPLEDLGLPALRARLDMLTASVAMHGQWPSVLAEYHALFGESPPHRSPRYDWREPQARLARARYRFAQAYDGRRGKVVRAVIADRRRLDPERDKVDLVRDTLALKDEELEVAYALLAEPKSGRRKLTGRELEHERDEARKAAAALRKEGIDLPWVSDYARVMTGHSKGPVLEAKRRWLDDHPEVLRGLPVRRQRRGARRGADSDSPNAGAPSPQVVSGSSPETAPDLR